MSTDPAPTHSSKPKRRVRKILLIGGLLLIAFVVALPYVASPFLPGFIVDRLETDLDARAELDEFTFRWPGNVSARGLNLAGGDGLPLLTVGALDVKADLMGAVKGRMGADVVIDGVQVDLRVDENGRWNFESLGKKKKSGGEKDEGASEPAEMPDARVHFELKNARVVVHAPNGSTEVHDIQMGMDMPGGDAPADISFGFGLRGPKGDAGSMSMAAQMGMKGDAVGKGHVEMELKGLLLAALEPVLLAVAPQMSGLVGRVEGALKMDMNGPSQVVGGGEFRIEDLMIPATREGAPAFRPGVTSLKLDMTPAEAGSAQVVTITLGDLLNLGYAGEMSDGAAGARRMMGEVTLKGSLSKIVAAAGSFAPITEGLAVDGAIDGGMKFSMSLGDAGPEDMALNLAGKVTEIAARDAAGKALDLEGIRELKLSLDGQMNAGEFSMPQLIADLGPVQVNGNARMTGLSGPDAKPKMDDSSFRIDVDLERLRRILDAVMEGETPDLAGKLRAVAGMRQDGDKMAMTIEIEPQDVLVNELGIAGDPIKGAFSMLMQGDDMTMSGGLGTPRLELTLAEGKKITQRDLKLDLDMSQRGETLDLRRMSLSSGTGSLGVVGKMEGSDPTVAVGDFKITVDAAIAKLIADAGPALGMAGYSGSGALNVGMDIGMRPAGMSMTGGLSVDRLDLSVPAEDPSQTPVRIQEDKVRFDLGMEIKNKEQQMLLKRFEITSKTLWGSMTGDIRGLDMEVPAEERKMFVEAMKGKFEYDPARLGAFVNPLLPGELSGPGPEELVIDFRGPTSDLDLFALLEHASMTMGLSLGTFTTAGVDTTGRIDVGVKDGRLEFTGDLGANGGSLDLKMGLGTSSGSSSAARQNANLSINLEAVKVNGGVQGLLGMVHPVFAPLSELGVADSVKALLTGELDLKYNGPMSLEDLASGWKNLPSDLLYGKGMIKLDDTIVSGSPLLSELMSQLGVGLDQPLQLAPIGFEIDSSKLTYAEAWAWDIGGIQTSFSGGVGLNGLLDLDWSIPISKQIAKKYPVLEGLVGQTMTIPLRGTSSAPKLDWNGAIQSLAGNIATSKTSGLAEEVGLGGVLGGVFGGSSDDPKALLAEADKLWSAGDKAAAAPIYVRIRDGFKISTEYLLNKDRIEKRAEWGGKASKDDGAPDDPVDPAAGAATEADPKDKDDKDKKDKEKSDKDKKDKDKKDKDKKDKKDKGGKDKGDGNGG